MNPRWNKLAIGLLLCAGWAWASQAAGCELTVYGDDIAQAGEFEAETTFSIARSRTNLVPGVRLIYQGLAEINYGLTRGWAVGSEVPAVLRPGPESSKVRHLRRGIRLASGSVDRWVAKFGLQFELD